MNAGHRLACASCFPGKSTACGGGTLHQNAFQVVYQPTQEPVQFRLLGGLEHSQDRIDLPAVDCQDLFHELATLGGIERGEDENRPRA